MKKWLITTLWVVSSVAWVSKAQFSRQDQACETDADCIANWEHCRVQSGLSAINNQKVCIHKDQFPMDLYEFLLCFV